MEVKVLKTTDGKFQGHVFEVEEFSNSEIERVSGKDFDFHIININGDIINLQSSNYTVKAIITKW